jgi:hypothetical protein
LWAMEEVRHLSPSMEAEKARHLCLPPPSFCLLIK